MFNASQPPVAPRAKLAHGIDRTQFLPELAAHPELIGKMAHMVFGEVGRDAPRKVKIVQLETAFNRAQARGQSLAHVLLSVTEDPETHQFGEGMSGYRLAGGDSYFREGPFLHPFPELSPTAQAALGLGGVKTAAR
jgi:hypothetical protein